MKMNESFAKYNYKLLHADVYSALGLTRFFTFAITTHPTLVPVVPTCSCDHTRHIDMPCNPEEAWVTFIHTWYTFVHTAATDACDIVTNVL